MVKITANEAKYLREHGHGDEIHISSKTHKSRGKRYYLTENREPMRLLRNFRRKTTVWSSGTQTK